MAENVSSTEIEHDNAEDPKLNSSPKTGSARAESSTGSNSPVHREKDMSSRKEKEKDREERVRLLRERQDNERQQKLQSLQEAQKQAEEYRQRQQDLRRQRIDELRRKESERRNAVDERRKMKENEDKSKREAILQKTSDRLARYEQWKSEGGHYKATRGLSKSMSHLCHGPNLSKTQQLNMSTSMRHIPSAHSPARVHRPKSAVNIHSASKQISADARKPRPSSVAASVSTPALHRLTPRSQSHRPSSGQSRNQKPENSATGVSQTPNSSSRHVTRATIDRLSTPRQRPKPETSTKDTAPSKTPAAPRTTPPRVSRKLPQTPAPVKDKPKRPTSATGKTKDVMSKSMHEILSPTETKPKPKSNIMSRSVTEMGEAKSLQDISEQENKAKIAEKRKEAKERQQRENELERQRQEQLRLEEEERLRQEEEAQRRLEEETLRLAEEARKAEEERLRLAIEAEEERKSQENARLEAEKLAREEQELKAREEADRLEIERQEKARKEEEERLERKRKLEMIMKRVKADSPLTVESKVNDATSRAANANVQAASDDEKDSAEDKRLDVIRNSDDVRPESSEDNGKSRFKSPLLQQLIEKRGDTSGSDSQKFKSPLLQNIMEASKANRSLKTSSKNVSFKDDQEKDSSSSMSTSLSEDEYQLQNEVIINQSDDTPELSNRDDSNKNSAKDDSNQSSVTDVTHHSEIPSDNNITNQECISETSTSDRGPDLLTSNINSLQNSEVTSIVDMQPCEEKSNDLSLNSLNSLTDITKGPDLLLNQDDHPSNVNVGPDLLHNEDDYTTDVNTEPDLLHNEDDYTTDVNTEPDLLHNEDDYTTDVNTEPDLLHNEDDYTTDVNTEPDLLHNEDDYTTDFNTEPDLLHNEDDYTTEVDEKPDLLHNKDDYTTEVNAEPNLLHNTANYTTDINAEPDILHHKDDYTTEVNAELDLLSSKDSTNFTDTEPDLSHTGFKDDVQYPNIDDIEISHVTDIITNEEFPDLISNDSTNENVSSALIVESSTAIDNSTNEKSPNLVDVDSSDNTGSAVFHHNVESSSVTDSEPEGSQSDASSVVNVESSPGIEQTSVVDDHPVGHADDGQSDINSFLADVSKLDLETNVDYSKNFTSQSNEDISTSTVSQSEYEGHSLTNDFSQPNESTGSSLVDYAQPSFTDDLNRSHESGLDVDEVRNDGILIDEDNKSRENSDLTPEVDLIHYGLQQVGDESLAFPPKDTPEDFIEYDSVARQTSSDLQNNLGIDVKTVDSSQFDISSDDTTLLNNFHADGELVNHSSDFSNNSEENFRPYSQNFAKTEDEEDKTRDDIDLDYILRETDSSNYIEIGVHYMNNNTDDDVGHYISPPQNDDLASVNLSNIYSRTEPETLSSRISDPYQDNDDIVPESTGDDGSKPHHMMSQDVLDDAPISQYPFPAWMDKGDPGNYEESNGDSSPDDIPRALIDSSISMKSEENRSSPFIDPMLIGESIADDRGSTNDKFQTLNDNVTNNVHVSNEDQYISVQNDDLLNFNTSISNGETAPRSAFVAFEENINRRHNIQDIAS